jgi:ElaB/YqjD/DUF883 family membrane-anchored ribosome-binding protein
VDNELEVIRHQMEEKRASLADKIDALENQVLEIVHETGDQVTNIVQEVTSGVSDVVKTVETVVDDVKSTANTMTEGLEQTVESVKETFNVSEHIRQHPWLALGGAFVAGLAGGYLTGSSSERSSDRWSGSGGSRGWSEPSLSTFTPPAPAPAPRVEQEQEPARDQQPESDSTWSVFGDAGKQALDLLKETAIGTLMGVLGQVVSNALPATLKSDASNILRDLTTKLGGRIVDVGEWTEQQGESEHCRSEQQGRAEAGQGANGAEPGGPRTT